MALPTRLLAPAKINLHLRVGKRRADGFHPLLTWMCTVGLFDILTLEAMGPTATADAAAMPRDPAAGPASPPAAGLAGEPAGADFPDLRFDCDQPGLPRDEDNLVVRIAKAFAAEVFAPPPSGRGVGSTAGGAMGSTAQTEGGGGAPDSAGAALRGALGICGADRPEWPEIVSGRAGRGAGAARDAERPVGKEDAGASPSDKGHSRGRTAEAPAAPAAPRQLRDRHGDAAGHGASVAAPQTSITLAKRIPVGAGLGGGSSDAARTLVGLNRLWDAGWAPERLSGFAARFGSDVPFFVAASFGAASAACVGRGEIVRPVPRPAPRWALLVLPPFPLATRDVYGRFDELGLGSPPEIPQPRDGEAPSDGSPDWRGWSALAAQDLLPRLVNDLEMAAFSLSPELAALRAAVERTVGRVVRMSGSGSSLFTLFDADEAGAARAAAETAARSHGVRVEVAEVCPDLAGDDAARGS